MSLGVLKLLIRCFVYGVRCVVLSSLCRDLGSLVSLSDGVRGLGVFIAYTIAWGEGISGDLSEEVSKLVDFLKGKYDLGSLKDDPVVKAYRRFFWRVGIDPTKTRPAAEALVRRVLRGKDFPMINPVVDAGNIASAYTMVPIGLYDLSKAKLPFELTMSVGGEVFRPLGGRDEVLREGVPILKDSEGKVLHIYPHRDSRETCITEGTREILILGAGVSEVPKYLVVKAVRKVIELLKLIGWESCDDVVIKE